MLLVFCSLVLNQLWNKASVRVHLNSIICNRAFSPALYSNFIWYIEFHRIWMLCVSSFYMLVIVIAHTRLFHVLLIAKRHSDIINNWILVFVNYLGLVFFWNIVLNHRLINLIGYVCFFLCVVLSHYLCSFCPSVHSVVVNQNEMMKIFWDYLLIKIESVFYRFLMNAQIR